MPGVAIAILATVAGLVMVYLGVDRIVDITRDAVQDKGVSPYLVGAILLGVDLEEIVASLTAAATGYPTVAIGNAIGNNTIALTLPVAIPAMIVGFRVKRPPRSFVLVLACLIGVHAIGIVVQPSFSFTFLAMGMAAIALYVAMLTSNVSEVVRFTRKATPGLVQGTIEMFVEREAGHGDRPDGKGDRDEVGEDMPRRRVILVACLSLACAAAGAWLLAGGIEGLVEVAGISQHVTGYVIVAAGVNIEEFILMFKSVKARIPELGAGGLLMKATWNLGLVSGVSVLVSGVIPVEPSLVVNLVLVSVTISLFAMILRAGKAGTGAGLALVVLFACHVIINLAIAG